MLHSASSNEGGIPAQLLEAKAKEIQERRDREAAIQVRHHIFDLCGLRQRPACSSSVAQHTRSCQAGAFSDIGGHAQLSSCVSLCARGFWVLIDHRRQVLLSAKHTQCAGLCAICRLKSLSCMLPLPAGAASSQAR